MKRDAVAVDAAQGGAISARELARGDGWQLWDYVCCAGPDDRPFEEVHTRMSISAVVAGTFNYRSGTGSAFLHPGAFLLGNTGVCYACGHEHGTGDRSISLQLEPEFFAEIAASAAGGSRFRFPCAGLVASKDLVAAFSMLHLAALRHDGLAGDEMAVRVAGAVSAHTSDHSLTPVRFGMRDERRIARVLQHIAANGAEELRLDDLARLAGMSRFHFLRVFRHVTGATPHAHILAHRMRQAAIALATSREGVAQIAFAAGFGDLSTFNARFRKTFGVTPTQFRAQHGRGTR